MATTINRDELKQKMDRELPFILVEALSPEQYRTAHLPTAINVPADRVKELAPKLLPDRQQDIVVYCASSTCNAAENAARELRQMGYENVRRYAGGKQDWAEAGLPLQGEQKHAA